MQARTAEQPPQNGQAVQVCQGEAVECSQDRLLLAEVTVAPDKASAELYLRRPEDGQPPLSAAELRDILHKRGVSAGILEDVLARMATQPEYNTPVVVARGLEPVHGENGRLNYHFDVERKLLPTENERGNVDYRNLNYVVNVAKGGVLCDMIQPTKGTPGYDVTGRPRAARDGAAVLSPVGVNTVLSEDGTQVLATCDGAAVLQAGKVCVAKSIDVAAVDGTTGNIIFEGGSVVVAGDVKEGFCITAGGDITVRGNVEGAKLTAGGSITLTRGMNGLGSGAIDAGRDVNANFLENIDIRANGTITADVILNCRVWCKGDVLLKGANAEFLGGECITYGSVRAKNIGNELDVVTKIELIGQKTIVKEREELAAAVEASAEEMRKLLKIAESGVRPGALIPEKRAAEKALVELQRLKDEADAAQVRLSGLQAQLDALGQLGVISAWGCMYPNTRMNFDTVRFNNNHQRTAACACFDQGEVAFKTAQKF